MWYGIFVQKVVAGSYSTYRLNSNPVKSKPNRRLRCMRNSILKRECGENPQQSRCCMVDESPIMPLTCITLGRRASRGKLSQNICRNYRWCLSFRQKRISVPRICVYWKTGLLCRMIYSYGFFILVYHNLYLWGNRYFSDCRGTIRFFIWQRRIGYREKTAW